MDILNTPEELILAANLVPVRLFGNQQEASTLADVRVQRHFCSFARSCLDSALKGRHRNLVGLVVTHGCDCTNQFYDLWQKHIDPGYLYYLHVPLNTEGDSAMWFFVNELVQLKHSLETFRDTEITQEDLRKAIKICNKTRKWLQKISEEEILHL